MGTSKRYAAAVDRQMDARILQRVMQENTPLTLTREELELDREPLTRAPIARPVSAWVRYAGTAVFLNAEAVEWTAHAVHVRWITPVGDRHHAWVWASAIRSRSEQSG
jgi:hypothetical protein